MIEVTFEPNATPASRAHCKFAPGESSTWHLSKDKRGRRWNINEIPPNTKAKMLIGWQSRFHPASLENAPQNAPRPLDAGREREEKEHARCNHLDHSFLSSRHQSVIISHRPGETEPPPSPPNFRSKNHSYLPDSHNPTVARQRLYIPRDTGLHRTRKGTPPPPPPPSPRSPTDTIPTLAQFNRLSNTGGRERGNRRGTMIDRSFSHHGCAPGEVGGWKKGDIYHSREASKTWNLRQVIPVDKHTISPTDLFASLLLYIRNARALRDLVSRGKERKKEREKTGPRHTLAGANRWAKHGGISRRAGGHAVYRGREGGDTRVSWDSWNRQKRRRTRRDGLTSTEETTDPRRVASVRPCSAPTRPRLEAPPMLFQPPLALPSLVPFPMSVLCLAAAAAASSRPRLLRFPLVYTRVSSEPRYRDQGWWISFFSLSARGKEGSWRQRRAVESLILEFFDSQV